MDYRILRSPLFYVGDKYRILNQILAFFPSKISSYYEPFVGGGSVFLNVNASKYYLNDVDKNLVLLHRYLTRSSKKPSQFFLSVDKIVEEYGLSRSFKTDIIPKRLKMKWKKTYFARFNKAGYNRLREQVNSKRTNDPLILYILLIYGFNRMLRFNGGGKFNLPVGNVDFNKNVVNALSEYFRFVRDKEIHFSTSDFNDFLQRHEIGKDDFVYFDPPYLVAKSEYNKLWDESSEKRLFNMIDWLHAKGVRFALSNVTHYQGRRNGLLIEWMKKYNIRKIKSNYISYHNNRQKRITEILLTNY